MKRTTLISASLLLAFAGCTCGQGWRPNIFSRMTGCFRGPSNVGEPCDAGCRAPMESPVAHGACETCGTSSSNYGGYDGQVIDSYEGVPAGSYNTGSSIPYNSQTYPIAQPAQGTRLGTEQILPKSAN